MKFQFVLQFPASGADDFDRMVELEEKLSAALGGEHDVDGHDFGSGEFNLFVHTNDPYEAYEKAKKILHAKTTPEFRAAFRELKGNHYTVIWPEGYDREFKVI